MSGAGRGVKLDSLLDQDQPNVWKKVSKMYYLRNLMLGETGVYTVACQACRKRL